MERRPPARERRRARGSPWSSLLRRRSSPSKLKSEGDASPSTKVVEGIVLVLESRLEVDCWRPFSFPPSIRPASPPLRRRGSYRWRSAWLCECTPFRWTDRRRSLSSKAKGPLRSPIGESSWQPTGRASSATGQSRRTRVRWATGWSCWILRSGPRAVAAVRERRCPPPPASKWARCRHGAVERACA